MDNVTLNDILVNVLPKKVLKQSRKDLQDEKLSCLKQDILRWNVVVGLDRKQIIISTEKPYIGESIDTMQRWVKEIFAGKNIIDLTTHSCWEYPLVRRDQSISTWMKSFLSFPRFTTKI